MADCIACGGVGSFEPDEAYMMMERPRCGRCNGTGVEPVKLSRAMKGALVNLLRGKHWGTGLHWGTGHVAASVTAGLKTMPALYRRGLVDGEWKLTDEGRRVARGLLEE